MEQAVERLVAEVSSHVEALFTDGRGRGSDMRSMAQDYLSRKGVGAPLSRLNGEILTVKDRTEGLDSEKHSHAKIAADAIQKFIEASGYPARAGW